MKSVYACLLLVILLLSFSVSAQQPFEEYGYKVRVGTLSQGKYEEFFDQDTLVQIGSVILNTITGKLEYFVKYDTSYSEATLQPEVISRWLSPDPLSEEYYSVSPYNFAGNNPVLFTDPTGAYITIYYEEDGEKKEYRYEQGVAYEGNNSFVANTVAQLDYLIANPTGDNNIIAELAGHKEFNWGISYVSMDQLDNQQNMSDYITTTGLIGTPYAGTTYNDLVGFETNTGGRQSPATTLLHEGGHARINMAYYELAQKYRETGDERYLQQMDALQNQMSGRDSPGYLDNEEKYVNDTYETPHAMRMGEGIRTSDRGNKSYQTAGPFTSLPSSVAGPIENPPGILPPSVLLRINR
ncbi:MAG: hypothetical protein ACOYXT_04125 [Bacteroidota bacterium]